jgi:hypothetical protein
MTREQLEHAIRAACDVAEDTEIWIFGSQAILGTYPDAPESLRRSVECDVEPKNRPDRVDVIDGVLGELSLFHRTHGFYVHGVSLETAQLPDGWKDRTVKIQNQNTRGFAGYCVEAHDLAASKLAASRERDRAFVRILLVGDLLDPQTLIERIRALPVARPQQERLVKWVSVTLQELD